MHSDTSKRWRCVEFLLSCCQWGARSTIGDTTADDFVELLLGPVFVREQHANWQSQIVVDRLRCMVWPCPGCRTGLSQSQHGSVLKQIQAANGSIVDPCYFNRFQALITKRLRYFDGWNGQLLTFELNVRVCKRMYQHLDMEGVHSTCVMTPCSQISAIILRSIVRM